MGPAVAAAVAAAIAATVTATVATAVTAGRAAPVTVRGTRAIIFGAGLAGCLDRQVLLGQAHGGQVDPALQVNLADLDVQPGADIHHVLDAAGVAGQLADVDQ